MGCCASRILRRVRRLPIMPPGPCIGSGTRVADRAPATFRHAPCFFRLTGAVAFARFPLTLSSGCGRFADGCPRSHK